MKSLRKRTTWILLTLFLLPVLVSFVWYNRQVRQQRLDQALIQAVKENDPRTAIALLDQGADANATDRPYTALNWKSLPTDFWNRLKGNQPPKNTLSDPSALMLLYGSYKRNRAPDRFSKPRDTSPLASALIEHGANPCMVDWLGWTLFHDAAIRGDMPTIQVLLEHHANLNVKDRQGRTPLMMANIDAARLLIEHGARVSMQDNAGKTALDYAREGKVDMIWPDPSGNVTLLFGRAYLKDYKDKHLISLLEAALQKEQAQQKSSASTDTK